MRASSVVFPRIQAQIIQDDGVISVIEKGKHLSFSVKRVYTIDRCVPKLIRGRHAHKKTFQAFFCLRGSVDLLLDNGKKKETIHVASSQTGVLIEPKVWHDMKNISSETLILVLASAKYDEKDYIRNYQEFLSYIKRNPYDRNE